MPSDYSCMPVDRPQSEEELVSIYEPVVSYWTFRARVNNLREQDDIRQDAYIGLLYAYRTFNPDKGCTFKVYAVNMVRYWALYNGLKQSDRNEHNAWKYDRDMYRRIKAARSLDQLKEDLDGIELEQLKDFSMMQGVQGIGFGFEDLLSMVDDERRRYILSEYYLGERTYDDIGRELGVTRERIRQLLVKTHAEIRRRLTKGRRRSPGHK